LKDQFIEMFHAKIHHILGETFHVKHYILYHFIWKEFCFTWNKSVDK